MIFTGEFHYVNITGFERTRFKSIRYQNHREGREKKPNVILLEDSIFNNRAFDFIDENLEFKLISSKNIAKIISKKYRNDDLELISLDF